MRLAHSVTIALTWFVCAHLHAQTTGSLSGRVLGEAMAPLYEANVIVLLPDTQFTTVSDRNGHFRFVGLPTGLYRIRASHVGYAPVDLSEVWVRSGKEEQVELSLARMAVELGTAEVSTYQIQRMNAVSSVPLTVEKSLRYPATFFDPARLAMSYPGIASTNDQGNHFSVRGNNPSNNAWLLEGVEIVNPNHLTNAGTQSDLPTLTGGGTTILSAQMLGMSQLLTGGMAAPYGNALGGIMDLRLRRGLTQRRANTLQAGLIGIDLSTEGPFRQGGRSSYLINYRYSTLGLLGAMGVALGDEALNFQDLAFTVNLPMGERTEVLLFGMGGNSSNRFDAKDSSDREFDKDSQDIDYEARMGAAGVSLRQRIGHRMYWHTTAVWSQNDQERRVEEAPFRRLPAYQDTTRFMERKLAVHSRLISTVGAKGRAELGLCTMQRTVEKGLSYLNERNSGVLLRLYARYEHDLSERVQLDLGFGYAHWIANGSNAVEPRAALRWWMSSRGRLLLALGVRSQLPPVQNYAVYYEWRAQTPIDPTRNEGLGLMRANEVELTYEFDHKPHLRTAITVFAQQQMNVPVGLYRMGLNDGTGLSMVNAWDELTTVPLSSSGEARMLGCHVSVERTLFRDLFYQVNASLLDATYVDGFGDTYDSRWNTRYITNAMVGREFVKQKDRVKRTWGINGRANMTGGQRYTSAISNTEPDPSPYSAQYPGTYRIDLRVYLRRERDSRTGLWALDLLNATNAQNVAYRYFDVRKGAEVTRYQLGVIPNLSYRIEF